MLVLSSVSVRFGGLQVLDKVNLTIPERGIFGLIGPNGAGKTTVFNLVTGLLSPSSGAIEFMGQRRNGMLPYFVAVDASPRQLASRSDITCAETRQCGFPKAPR